VPFLATLALSGAVALPLWKRTQLSLPAVPLGSGELCPLLRMQARLQRERFVSPLLCRVQSTLAKDCLSPLARLLGALPLAPLAFPLLATGQLALAIEAWRARHGKALANWLAALGQLEALSALAAYAYEVPADTFPEVVAGAACFEAEGLGHPLLPAARCVRNDVHLNADQRLLIVSGSNMSGKSTLLRTVGVNAVLALIGAPVRAVRLRLSPLTLGATLRLQDSLLEGRSRFFAEVTRIRQLLDLVRAQPPLLFLLDELFSGTNSEDRRQGAEAVVRRLLDGGAIGLLTTHDLALMHLVDVLGPRAVNVHFTDQFVDGAMTFDYRMRPGALRSGNGVALMRAVGIEV
jgi:DNA mismatch repair ATPase MutS